MGSTYGIYDTHEVEVFIEEMSNRLSLVMFDKKSEALITTNDLSIKEMLELVQRMLLAISYWTPESEFYPVLEREQYCPFPNEEEQDD